MVIFTVIGTVCLVFGIAILVAPGAVKKMSREMDKVLLIVDENIEKYNISIGVISTAVGIVSLFLVYYLKVR